MVVHLPASTLNLADWHIAITTEQYIARAIVVDDLLVDSAAFGGATALHTRALRHTLVHGLDLVEGLTSCGVMLLFYALRRGHRAVEKLAVGGLRVATRGMLWALSPKVSIPVDPVPIVVQSLRVAHSNMVM